MQCAYLACTSQLATNSCGTRQTCLPVSEERRSVCREPLTLVECIAVTHSHIHLVPDTIDLAHNMSLEDPDPVTAWIMSKDIGVLYWGMSIMRHV